MHGLDWWIVAALVVVLSAAALYRFRQTRAMTLAQFFEMRYSHNFQAWLRFWQAWTWVVLAASIAVVTWFSIGGARDIVYLFRNLRLRENPLEDGRVPDH